jgi:chemotaxis methyl-accepting protein methylase
MGNKIHISEQEKERILNLHKKQIIVEQNNYKPIMENRLKKLILEQQNQEIETLIDNISENDPPEEWQKIVPRMAKKAKIDATAESKVLAYVLWGAEQK